jgi:hypothetical protein
MLGLLVCFFAVCALSNGTLPSLLLTKQRNGALKVANGETVLVVCVNATLDGLGTIALFVRSLFCHTLHVSFDGLNFWTTN